MKLNLLVTTLLASAALGLPLRAQTAVTGDTPAAVTGTSTTSENGKAHTHDKLHFGGSLSAVDTTANTITVQNKKQGPRTFQLTGSTVVTKADGSTAALADLKPGDHVHGAYKKTADGKMELLTLKVGRSAKKAAAAQ